MINLDDPLVYEAFPSLPSVITSIDSYPKQLLQAWQQSSTLQFPDEYKKAKNIVVCGMGGSRFTPLAVKELFKDKLTVPYIICDDYALPGFVNNETLVILSSYSGTTEEVISCGQQAINVGAKVTAVTLGGQLANLLTATGTKMPFYQFTPTHNPSGQPRIGVGYMLAGHIGIVTATGHLSIQAQEVEIAITNVSKLLTLYANSIPLSTNSAKQIAQTIYQMYPYVVTSEFLQGFGNCLGNALNETAKSISSPRVIPEINHHMMEGLQFPTAHKDIGLFLFFFSKLYDMRIQKRFTITKDVVEQNGLKTYWHELQGATKMEQLFEAIGLGSYITLYLSVLYNQDPNQIPWVDLFKRRLKEEKYN